MHSQSVSEVRTFVSSLIWHHSIDLGNGIITHGTKSLEAIQFEYNVVFDQIDLTGQNVLDVGAWNGGFSVEAWRRGASLVTGLDHYTWNHPDYRGRETFEYVSEITGAKFKSIDRDLDDPRLDLRDIGYYDVVLFLGVFYHLKNPLSALREVSAAIRDILVLETFVENFSPDRRPMMVLYPGSELVGDPTNWWGPNIECIVELLKLAGFIKVTVATGATHNRKVFHAYRTNL
jgi:tRNA (mo5U34)-methyltransferase